ncbi:MAG TPA: glycosyltransferase [Anaerolineales bacterium]|nr:glycosyltransferase [Anaerolineales bacterium]
MKILYLTRGWTVHDRRFVGSLLGAGHSVALRAVEHLPASAMKDLAAPDRVSGAGWEAAGAMFWVRLPWMVRDLRRLVRDVQPDVIHAGPIQRGALVAALADVHPMVSMSWGSDVLWEARRGWGEWLASFVLRHSDALICDCETVRQRSVGLGMDPSRIVVFPWGVDLKAFSPKVPSRIRRVLGWETAVVLMSARPWESMYGTRLVAEAFALAAAREPGLRLLMLGNGSDRQRVRKPLETGRLTSRAHFPGPVDHEALPTYFRAADLYVSASRVDGTSVTLLEAMASGLPAAVSDIPSNREWIDGTTNGWVFRDGDARSLGDLMVRAVSERRRLPAMGRAARHVAEARADWSKNFPRLEKAYRTAQAHTRRSSDAT